MNKDKSIWKYKLTPAGVLRIPEGAQFLHIQAQGDDICLWFLVDTTKICEDRSFKIIGTGWPIEELAEESSESLKYVGTVHLVSGLVFHLFEKLK